MENINQIQSKELQLKETIKDDLRKQGKLEDYGDIKVTYIKSNLFSVEGDNGNIVFYCDKDGKIVFNIKSVADGPHFQKSQILSGYVEKKDEKNGEYKMFEIKTINGLPYKEGLEKLTDVSLKDINIGIGNEINKYTEEYFKIWQNIDFYEGKQFLETLKLEPISGEKRSILDEQYLNVEIPTKHIRIKDFLFFLKNGQLKEGKNLFDKMLPKVKSLLVEQVGDRRFDNVGDPVTIEELEGYYKEGYISKELLKLCIDKMLELGKIDKKIADEIKKEFGLELSSLKDQILSA